MSLFLKLYSHTSVLWRSCRISMISKFSFLGVRLKTKSWKSRIIFIFKLITLKCMRVLFFDHCFDFLRVETGINKSGLNLINLEQSEAIKRHLPATWLTMPESCWLWCHMKSISTPYEAKFSVFVEFSEFSPLGIGFKTKNRKSHKIFIFWIYKGQLNEDLFLINILTFWVLKLTHKKTGPKG